MAENLSNFPGTVELLNEQQIGYHSSGHSIHPTIFEFSDVTSYQEAYQISLTRETAHINPLTGSMEGEGGIYALKALFPKKQIVSFRAPGYCWNPPHLEAMKTLGINYDFSTRITADPFNYQGITFYPFPLLTNDWQGGFNEHFRLQLRVLKHKTSVLTFHPSKMVNQGDWDFFYYSQKGISANPSCLSQPRKRNPGEVATIFHEFDLLLRHIKVLQKTRFLEVTSKLQSAKKTLSPSLLDAQNSYEFSIEWAKTYGYKPKFLYKHFLKFFKS